MKSHKATAALSIALAVAVMTMPELAFAQATGGGGQMAGVVTWLVSNIGKPMLYAGILMLSFLLLGGRISLSTVAMVAAGGLVMANYGAIAGFFAF